MTVLAIVPSASIVSAIHGIKNSAAVSADIELGDLIFAALTVLGMSAFAHTFDPVFSLLNSSAVAN